jgi:multidrug efflux pump subunit AcrA (membrane-fusion protein)
VLVDQAVGEQLALDVQTRDSYNCLNILRLHPRPAARHMNRSRKILIAAAVILVALAAYAIFAPAKPLVLTGIVTTNDVIVSPQVNGQVQKLLVNEGDSVVPGQLLALLSAGVLAADQAF